MSNTFITPTVIAKSALATLYNTTVLAQLVMRDYEEDFTGKQGDTITVRTPATFTANTFNRASGIQLQDATEGSFPVQLDTLLDVSFAVTAEDLTLRLEDFQTQLLTPAMEAISQQIDGLLAEKLTATAIGGSGGGTVSGASTPNLAFRNARAKLGRAKLPANNRYVVVSPEANAAVLGDSLFVQAQMAGTTDGLREANIGRAFGFDTYESQVFGFGPGEHGHADGVAFHQSAVSLVSRTLQTPTGIPSDQVATANYKGLGLRVVKSYDITKKQDVISVDTLIGIKAIRPQAAVELDFGQGS